MSATSTRFARTRAVWRAVRQRVSLLGVVAVALYVASLFARFAYAVRFHNPRHYVTSDAIPITSLAQTLIDPNAEQQFFHTVWPPGMASVLAVNLLFDPSLASAALLQFVLSSSVPILIGHAAYMAFGRRAAWAALIASSLHLGFIHYTGFFLSEQLCQFATTLAIWATVLAIGQRDRAFNVLAGLGAGLAWGLAFSFRPNALPIVLCIGVWLALRWWRRRRQALVTLGAAVVGLSLAIVPLAHRCTTLLGQFCPGSSNGAMNMAMGQAEDAAGIVFRGAPGEKGSGFSWYPPARLHHGYSGAIEVPAVFYDTRGLLRWLAGRFTDDPLDFSIVMLGNALDLFGMDYWPDDYARLPPRWAEVSKQLFYVCVLFPGVVGWQRLVFAFFRRRDVGDVGAVLVSGVTGLLLLGAISIGEARYRIPFDALFILLAAELLRQPQADVVKVPPARWRIVGARAAVVALAVCTGSAIFVILAVAHPATALAARLAKTAPPPQLECPVERSMPIAALSQRRRARTSWDDESNVLLRRRRTCAELRVTLGEVVRHRKLEVSSDHNDRYWATFYRAGAAVGSVAWGLFEGDKGLRMVRVAVPETAVRAGYEEIGISAMYGDGRYAVGHVRLTD